MPMQNRKCLLTTKDHTILEVMMERCLGRDDPLRAILEEKLGNAVVMFREDIPPIVVTLNSRIRYRVNDEPAETRIVSNDEMRGLVGSVLSITNPRGLALMGLVEGQAFRIAASDGSSQELTVLEVVYQPEAATREARLTNPAAPRGPILRVVHSSDDLPKPPRANTPWPPTGFDDPGPSAA